MVVAHPSCNGEALPVVNDMIQDDGKEAFVIDELLGTFGHAEDGDVVVHGPHAVGEAHEAESGDNLLQVEEADEVVGQDLLDGQAHFPGGCIELA
ncbi:hypothetical protein Y1Q_0020166 [Alligator mississippiensis]|uniref:Uncharacterized protein n=1 Tax=Alligator mississippiensis TaxID=8496 RepID=A0A151NTK5_ALLMI|nr:hypothetical protein Y1Q_0020166 [Alligator mississippiensis]